MAPSLELLCLSLFLGLLMLDLYLALLLIQPGPLPPWDQW